MMNKCCSDKVKQNLLEAFECYPPIHLYSGGKYSWQEEKVYNKLLEFMPEDYLREYFFYNYADDIQEQVLQENITNAESKMECG